MDSCRQPHMRQLRQKRRKRILASLALSFGRHAGKPLASVPRSYLRWALSAPGVPLNDRWIIEQFLRPKPSNTAPSGAEAVSVVSAAYSSGEMATWNPRLANRPKDRPEP